MANDAPHFRGLAAQAYAEAEGATLANVRERALRSAAAFEQMAIQIERTARRRAERDAETQARIGIEPPGGEPRDTGSSPSDAEMTEPLVPLPDAH